MYEQQIKIIKDFDSIVKRHDNKAVWKYIVMDETSQNDEYEAFQNAMCSVLDDFDAVMYDIITIMNHTPFQIKKPNTFWECIELGKKWDEDFHFENYLYSIKYDKEIKSGLRFFLLWHLNSLYENHQISIKKDKNSLPIMAHLENILINELLRKDFLSEDFNFLFIVETGPADAFLHHVLFNAVKNYFDDSSEKRKKQLEEFCNKFGIPKEYIVKNIITQSYEDFTEQIYQEQEKEDMSM